MPSEESKLKQYLSVAKYRYVDTTRVDVLNVSRVYKGLSVGLETFVFDNGTQKELVKVHGTIPVTYKEFSNGTKKRLINLNGTIPVPYKDNVYHIPVCIWIMDTHPFNAPVCYVKPTADMRIKVSKYVDHNGKIYLPYLHNWQPQQGSHDLMGLVQVMIMVFGEQPPVYSYPKTSAQQPQTASSTPYPTQPTMPMPGVNPAVNSQPGYTPPYPAYPVGNAPYPSMQGGPGYPPNTTGYPPYPTPGSGYPPYPTGAVQPPVAANSAASSGYPPYPGYPPSNSAATAQAADGTIKEQHIKASLLSAIEDKLKRRLREQFSQGTAELETLRRTNEELTQGRNRLQALMTRLERENSELDKSIAVLQEKETELEKGLTRLAEQEPIDVDEAVTTTAPLYKQLLNAFAEESAIEDALYYLGEALRRGVIDLDVFLKQVRALSRKQFMLRALMHRCRQKAGLAG